MREKLGERFYITISFEECLTVYSEERWKKAEEKLETMSQVEQMEIRPVFSSASEVELDGQGRIPLTKELREHAGLTKNVSVVGTGLYVQIWDSDKYKQIQSKEYNSENLKNAIGKLGF